MLHGRVTMDGNRVKVKWKRDKKCNLYERNHPETYGRLLFMLLWY